MDKKIVKRILIIVTLLMILIVAYRLINTYALFYSEGQGVVKQNNATWQIYLNDKNIVSTSISSFDIDTFEIEDNSHVSPRENCT